MEFAQIVYVISILPGMEDLFGVIIFCTAIGLAALAVYSSFSTEFSFDDPEVKEQKRQLKKTSMTRAKWLIGIAVFSGLMIALIPTEKQLYAIAGAYAAQKTVESPEFKRLAGKSLQAIELKLDEYITEAEEQLTKKEAK